MARPVAEAPCRSAFAALRLRGRSPVPGAARPWSEPTGGVVISAPERAGQPEEVSGEGLDQPVGDERVEAPLTLDDVVGHALEDRPRHRSGALPQAPQQGSPHLTVGAGPGLAPSWWPLVGGTAQRLPPAQVEDRALAAAGCPGGADERSQLQHRDAPG